MAKKITLFGRKCREFRSRSGVTMFHQAQNTKFSPAYISLIESGKRPRPDNYLEAFAAWLELSPREIAELESLAIDVAEPKQVARNTRSERLRLAEEIAETAFSMPVERLKQLRNLIAEPSKDSYSDAEICERATLFRSVFNPSNRVEVNAVEIVETFLSLVDPEFALRIEHDLNFRSSVEAYSDQTRKESGEIVVSERLYITANRFNDSSRYALLHEFAHWVLHRNKAHAFFRLRKPGAALGRYKAQEEEADRFVREFLFPRLVVNAHETPAALSKAACMPLWVTNKRLNELAKLTDSGSIGDGTEKAAGNSTETGAQVRERSLNTSPKEGTEVVSAPRVLLFRTLVNRPVALRHKSRKRRQDLQGDDLFTFAERRSKEKEQEAGLVKVDLEKKKRERCEFEARTRAPLRSKTWYEDNGWR